MRWLRLTLAYDGGAYAGWQYQPQRPTIQGTLEQAWQQITQEQIRIVGSGRTDAGVHAWGQVASLASQTQLPCDTLQRGLNAKLPRDVVVREVVEAQRGFHASRDAARKCYHYQIHNQPLPSVFQRHYTWHVSAPLDVQAMHESAQHLVGKHDFASFQSASSPREDTVRTIYRLAVSRRCGTWSELLVLEVEGDGFLYNMVRTLAGTLAEVGRGRRSRDWIREVLDARDRRWAGRTAPPQGLFLMRVEY